MPTRPIKGTAQLNCQIAVEVLERLRTFCKERGEAMRYHLEMALRRHMDNPPPLPEPPPPPPPLVPLPPLTVPTVPPAKKPAARSKRK